MARQDIQNTFSEGLINDLNPINTPNTALTDCLNGTIITYNGNELSLQNDQGNYPLTYCKLPPNYIPVGIKEYGGILYIVSHNPVTDKTQIGSYPAPETITDPDDLKSLTQSITDSYSGNYSELKEDFAVFYGTPPEKHKLNPGDWYRLNMTGAMDSYIRTEYFIIDENRKPFDISDKIKLGSSSDSDTQGFNCVNWDVPGWLAIRNHIVSPDDFQINVYRVVVPSYGNKAKLKLSFQATGSDKYFLNNEGSAILCSYSIQVDGKNVASSSVGLGNSYNIATSQKVFYSDPLELEVEVDNDSIITITAFPKIAAINYDNLAKTLTFNVANKGNVEDFLIGDNRWVYYTDKINNQLVLTFDTAGIDQTSVLDKDVYLYYTIKKAKKDTVLENLPIVVNQKLIDSWAMIEDSTIRIPFDDIFVPEDVYIFEFSFYESDTINVGETPLKTITKIATVTELMNDFNVTDNYSRYDLIPFDKWVTKYFSATETPEFYISKLTGDCTGNWEDISGNQTPLMMWFNDNKTIPKYSTLNSSVKNSVSSNIELTQVKNFTVSGSYGNNFQLLLGPLWEDLAAETKVNYDFAGVSASNYTNAGAFKQDVLVSKSSYLKANKSYSLEHLGDYYSVWNYSDEPIDYSYADTTITVTADGNSLPVSVGLKQDLLMQVTRSDGSVGDKIASVSLAPGKESAKSYLNEFVLNELNYTNAVFVRIKLVLKSDNVANKVFVAGCTRTPAEKSSTGAIGGYDYKLDKTFGTLVNFEDSTEHSSYLTENFVIFKWAVPYRGESADLLLWFPTDLDFSDFAAQMKSYKHLQCIDSTKINGYFTKATENSAGDIESTWSYNITGNLHPNTFFYQDTDMFSDTDRATWINDAWNVPKNNFIAEKSLSYLEDFELTSYNGKIELTNIGAPDFSTWVNKIDSRNKIVNDQYTNYLKDHVFMDGDHTSSSDVFYKTSGGSDDYLDVLNQNFDMTLYRNKVIVAGALASKIKTGGFSAFSTSYGILGNLIA